jgi:hypothetical protein
MERMNASVSQSQVLEERRMDASIAPFVAQAARQHAQRLHQRQRDVSIETRPRRLSYARSASSISANASILTQANRRQRKDSVGDARSDKIPFNTDAHLTTGLRLANTGPSNPPTRGRFSTPEWIVAASQRRRIIQTPHGPALLLDSNSASIDSPHSMEATVPANVHSTESIDLTPQRKFQRWSEAEDAILRHAVDTESAKPSWKKISNAFFGGTRTPLQCKSRWMKALQPGLKVGEWTDEEDSMIARLREDGIKWSEIADYLPGRLGEHIRDRYINFLDPGLKKTPWTNAEDKILFEQQKIIGNKWTKIAVMLPGRSENAVKNRWHNAKMTQRRRMRKRAIDKGKGVTDELESETESKPNYGHDSESDGSWSES